MTEQKPTQSLELMPLIIGIVALLAFLWMALSNTPNSTVSTPAPTSAPIFIPQHDNSNQQEFTLTAESYNFPQEVLDLVPDITAAAKAYLAASSEEPQQDRNARLSSLFPENSTAYYNSYPKPYSQFTPTNKRAFTTGTPIIAISSTDSFYSISVGTQYSLIDMDADLSRYTTVVFTTTFSLYEPESSYLRAFSVSEIDANVWTTLNS